MASITLIILDFILSVIVFFGGGWVVFRRTAPDGVAVSASNVAALVLMILLGLQVIKVLPGCG